MRFIHRASVRSDSNIPVDSRTTSSGLRMTPSSACRPVSIDVTVSDAARLPSSYIGWAIVVRGGWTILASTVSSNPMMEMSSGTRFPSWRQAWMAPTANWSLAAKMADTGCLAISSVAIRVPVCMPKPLSLDRYSLVWVLRRTGRFQTRAGGPGSTRWSTAP